MAYSVGGLIEATDYNGFADTTVGANVNATWSTGTTSAGYGQTALGTVSAGATVSATNWASLVNNIASLANHQGTTITSRTAPVTGGTGLFMYKRTGARMSHELEAYEAQDMTKWEMVDRIGNRYNRLVFYRSDLFHTSLDYFGSDLQDGRLFQLFFLTTQY